MMNTEFIKKQIQSMDIKSNEFWDIYTMVCDKYYTFPNPDDFLTAIMDIRMYIDKSTNNYEEQVIVIHKILEQIFYMEKEETGACAASVGFKGKDYFFTIATDKKQIKEMENMLAKVLKGDFKVNGK